MFQIQFIRNRRTPVELMQAFIQHMQNVSNTETLFSLCVKVSMTDVCGLPFSMPLRILVDCMPPTLLLYAQRGSASQVQEVPITGDYLGFCTSPIVRGVLESSIEKPGFVTITFDVTPEYIAYASVPSVHMGALTVLRDLLPSTLLIPQIGRVN